MVHSTDYHPRASKRMAILPMENPHAETTEGISASHGGRTHTRAGTAEASAGKSDGRTFTPEPDADPAE